MSTLLLEFGGYFQMRMATYPDPTDELRGVSGYTFALAGDQFLDLFLRALNSGGVFAPGKIWSDDVVPGAHHVARVDGDRPHRRVWKNKPDSGRSGEVQLFDDGNEIVPVRA